MLNGTLLCTRSWQRSSLPSSSRVLHPAQGSSSSRKRQRVMLGRAAHGSSMTASRLLGASPVQGLQLLRGRMLVRTHSGSSSSRSLSATCPTMRSCGCCTMKRTLPLQQQAAAAWRPGRWAAAASVAGPAAQPAVRAGSARACSPMPQGHGQQRQCRRRSCAAVAGCRGTLKSRATRSSVTAAANGAMRRQTVLQLAASAARWGTQHLSVLCQSAAAAPSLGTASMSAPCRRACSGSLRRQLASQCQLLLRRWPQQQQQQQLLLQLQRHQQQECQSRRQASARAAA